MQNGFLNFWKNRAKARDEVAYLYACVRTAAMDLTRAGRRRDHRELHAQPFIPSAFEPAIERLERQASIEAAIQRLAGDQREVVVMKIWGGLTFSQIAEALDIPPKYRSIAISLRDRSPGNAIGRRGDV